MPKPIKVLLYRHLLPWLGLGAIHLLSATYRYRFVDEKREKRLLEEAGSVIYACWHQRFFAGIAVFAPRRPIAIMISRSRDGELISRIAAMLGWQPVRGSSSRGGARALVHLKRLAAAGYRMGHIVDGPRGPFGEVKPGLLKIAQISGAPIMPVIVSPRRKWTFRSWDRFMIPKPFSPVIIRFGEPIPVERRLNASELEILRRQVEDRLAQLYHETDRFWERPS